MWGHENRTPDWVRDAIFYQIFPDRFARSAQVPKPSNLEPWDVPPTVHGFKGGDLVGVVEKLDYIQDLGVTAIYFTPIFQSAANHRYHTHDYYQVDPILGGNAALRLLLREAHARGMRIVIDGVFNHASRGFFQFHHLLENGSHSPYVDWFTVLGWPLNPYDSANGPNYLAWYNLPALPKFNTATPAVREFLLEVAEYWINFGVDGWRLDVPNEINDDAFWQEFRRRVKRANPEAYIVGEIWHDARRWLQGDQFDAVMNYLFTRLCLGFCVGGNLDMSQLQGTGLYPLSPLDGHQFAAGVEELLRFYHPEVTGVQLNLLDSHDTARFITAARGDEGALRLATLFQMTFPGAPSIFYGDEIGKPGGKDPDTRYAMPWDAPWLWETGLYTYFKQLTALRHAHPALRRGDMRLLYTSGAMVAFRRTLARAEGPPDDLVIALNAAPATRVADLHVGGLLPEGAVLKEAWSGAVLRIESGVLHLRVPPRSGMVWTVEVGGV